MVDSSKLRRYFRNKAHITLANAIIKPATSRCRHKYKEATHIVSLVNSTLYEEQPMAIFINDGYEQGYRFVLFEGRAYRAIDTVCLPKRGMSFILSEAPSLQVFLNDVVERFGVRYVWSDNERVALPQ
jgi:hypothetical protein